MAEALVLSMLEKLPELIQAQIQQQVQLVVVTDEEVEDLTKTFNDIQSVLNDAEQRQFKEKDVKLWLEDLKDLAYDMDDVLDEWSYEIEMHKSQNDTSALFGLTMVSAYLRSFCSCFGKFILNRRIGTEIKDIKKRLDGAVDRAERVHKLKSSFGEIKRPQSTTSITDVSSIVGRVKDIEIIMNKLMFLGECSTQAGQAAPNIITIVGMGGLGKTTLAQRVYDEVKTHFEITMWVCVSDPFDLVTVAKSIIKQAKCKDVHNSSKWNEELHESLIESLKGKRFLLVLDDVWTVDRDIRENLELSFKHGAEGSRILITTRIEKVAVMMKATYTHTLGILSDNDCSLLLSRIALAGRNEENHEELKKIGEKISKKCKGLPLAAKTLGGLLQFKKSKKEWLHVLESEILELEYVKNDKYLMPSLLFSYYDLPIHIKGCFLYCSIFPKDHVIEKDLLIKLWMAQGFLIPGSTNEELEMIGEDYFNNLVMRSFFQDFTKDDNGDIISCKMHDLVHDLAQYLTKNECYVKEAHKSYDDEKELNISRVRHLTLIASYYGFPSSVYNAEKLRTLQILDGWGSIIEEAPADLFHQFRCLKVLCLNDIGLENLSGEIGNLIHLRYLDLSNNSDLKILPETISNLYNLQTLTLKDCRSLCKLPREMRRMINLRHLDISGTDELSYIPQGIGGLTCLRTLSDFIVGGGASEEEGCKISELKNLNLVQGGLKIRGLGRVENEANLEMVLKQKQLHSLRLDFKHNYDEVRENGLILSKRMDQEDVLDVLEPHPDVVKLRVDVYLDLKLSSWIGSTSILSHLKTLQLWYCINLTKLPAFGQLPSLEELVIEGAEELRHIGCEFLYELLVNEDEEEAAAGGEVLRFNNNTTAFPKLKSLRIVWGAEEMELEWEWEWEWELEETAFPILPCLRELEIGGFRNSKPFVEIISKISSLETLRIWGEATEFVNYIRHDDDLQKFPNLKKLVLYGMKDMEELKIGFQVMPLLNSLVIYNCNLKAIIQVGGSLESLKLVGGCASSLYQLGIPNLKRLQIKDCRLHPSLLPEAFATTTTLQATLEELIIDCWSISWTCMPEQVQQLTSLKWLKLRWCGDELVQRCRKDQGEDWRIISHIPNIRIN